MMLQIGNEITSTQLSHFPLYFSSLFFLLLFTRITTKYVSNLTIFSFRTQNIDIVSNFLLHSMDKLIFHSLDCSCVDWISIDRMMFEWIHNNLTKTNWTMKTKNANLSRFFLSKFFFIFDCFVQLLVAHNYNAHG